MLEIENPDLAQERMKTLYEQKGYPKDWIDKRTLFEYFAFLMATSLSYY